MKVNADSNLLYVTFDFDYAMVSKIKNFPSRTWNALFKRWEIPNDDKNILELQKLGFNLDNVIAKNKQQNENKAIDAKIYEREILRAHPFLYNHQVECVVRGLTEGNLLIADDMGVGKTIESLAIADNRMKHEGSSVVIVCPVAIKKQWQREAKKWFNMDLAVIEGTKPKRALLYTKHKNIIIGYEQLRNDYSKIKAGNTIVIFDEASYLKNDKAQRTIVANRYAKRCKYVLALTGTPIETKLIDGFHIGGIVKPFWMSKNEFYQGYCIHQFNEAGFNVLVGYKNVDDFMKRLQSISIRRMKEDIKDMPGKMITNRVIPLSPQQIKITKIIKRNLASYEVIPIEEFVIMPIMENSLTLLSKSNSKLARLCRNDYTLEVSNKLKELVTIADELSAKKIVIFTRFKKMLPLIQEQLPNSLVGSGDTKDKIGLIDDFRNGSERFLIVTDAFSYGVDMPFATALINFDVPWNHARLIQREDRIYRITSETKVIIINLIADGFEQYIHSKMMSGKNIADKFNVRSAMREYING